MKMGPRGCKGVMLIDAMVALSVLGIGILGVGVLQVRSVEAGTQAQTRLLATQLADELVSLALVDPAHGACYQLPAASCSNSAAATAAELWKTRAAAKMPSGATTKSSFDGQFLRVTLTWPAKGTAGTHQLEATSDVRP